MNLDVLIPSLLLPSPMQKLLSPPVAPALEKLLARADRRVEVTPAGSMWLSERWGLNEPYPIAPLLADFDGLEPSSDGWMFAEPVKLELEGNLLKLFPARFLELTTAETGALVSALNVHFGDQHLQFFAPTTAASTQRWYVRCPPTEIPNTTSSNDARFGPLIDFQPRSTGTIDWRSLQNESQMLFFSHPVNAAREAAGKPPISGVWFWGGGCLPKLNKPMYDRVVASSPLAMQLATTSGIELRPLSWDSIQSAQGNVLAVIDSCAELAGDFDLPGWGREIERLECDWFLPMALALKKGVIERLNLYVPATGHMQYFHITRRNQFRRFWRSAKPLSSYA